MNRGKTKESVKRVVDTTAYLSVLRELVENGESVSVLISGMSMFPFLCHDRDTVFFQAPDRDLRKGDIVFYQRRNGKFVMHRICMVKDDGYYIVGDAQDVIEGPVSRDQIFAVVTRVLRDGRELDPSSLTWKFFEIIWIRVIPLRRYLMLPFRAARKLKLILRRS